MNYNKTEVLRIGRNEILWEYNTYQQDWRNAEKPSATLDP